MEKDCASVSNVFATKVTSLGKFFLGNFVNVIISLATKWKDCCVLGKVRELVTVGNVIARSRGLDQPVVAGTLRIPALLRDQRKFARDTALAIVGTVNVMGIRMENIQGSFVKTPRRVLGFARSSEIALIV